MTDPLNLLTKLVKLPLWPLVWAGRKWRNLDGEHKFGTIVILLFGSAFSTIIGAAIHDNQPTTIEHVQELKEAAKWAVENYNTDLQDLYINTISDGKITRQEYRIFIKEYYPRWNIAEGRKELQGLKAAQ